MQIIFAFIILGFTFYFLAVLVEEFFIDALDKISQKLNLSSEVAGATFMAVGSSSPELFTALIAAFRGGAEADIGTGTIVGSAIFNILVIIGASAMFKKAVLTWQPVMRDLIFYGAAIMLLLSSFWDGEINLFEALSFIGLYIIYIFAVTQWSKWLKYEVHDSVEVVAKNLDKKSISSFAKKLIGFIVPNPEKNYMGTFIMSIILIGALSFVMVEAAVFIAHAFEIAPALIGLTILAAGTSIPDLISSVIVAKQGRGDMAIANAVGSNIFDILIGLGLPWVLVLTIKGEIVQVGTENLLSSVFLLFATVVAVFFVLAVRKWQIGKRAGFLLILLYVFYIIYSVVTLS